MDVIGSDKFLLVVKGLPDGKAADIFGIPNKLWKHGDAQILNGLLDILNVCLELALIKTAKKILSKILSDRIFLACSKFNVFCESSTQTLIFTIGSIIEDVLEKNRELWLVLQNMQKTYDSVITDFELTDGYTVHNRLDQEEVFLPLLWRIFYNLLLCKVKKHEQLCGYRLNSKILIRTSRANPKGIFFSMDGLFKLSLAKAYLDVKFFSNVVLRKAITKKQFLYLVSAVLQSIVGYRLQFICVSKGNFPNKALYHPELYSLRTFEQVLAENLLAGLLLVNLANCFLAGATCALKLCNLLLGGDLPNVFWARNNIAVLDVLGFESYLSIVKSLKRYGVVFINQLLDRHSLVPVWFAFLVKFIIKDGLLNGVMLSPCSVSTDSSCNFGYVDEHLLNSGLGFIIIYTNGSVKNLGLLHAHGGTTAYFPDVDTSVGIKMDGLLLSILVEIQTIALALEFDLYTDSQASLDLCKSTSGMAGLNFYDKCWIEKKHICCVIAKKNLSVMWNKVKDHSGIVKNKHADFYANATVTSKSFLPIVIPYHFLIVEGRPVSRNTHHVAKKLFNAVYSVGWEARCVDSVISVDLSNCFDKARIFCVWHPNGRIRSGYTSTASVTLQSYFMKALHYYLPVAKKKKMYNPNYPSVFCIQCGLVEDFDHVFSCSRDVNVRNILLSDATLECNVLLGAFVNGNAIADLLNKAASSINLFTVLVKSFVLKSWVVNIVDHLDADSDGGVLVVNFICHFAESYRSAIWLSVAKLRVYYEKYNLLLHDELSISLVSGLSFS
ncbi:hypothetical protein G9A89_022001 [Geosiphon pyriformis]|nr:hypothetical protein G9A89_022001 [Geosiphon pyriformis]